MPAVRSSSGTFLEDEYQTFLRDLKVFQDETAALQAQEAAFGVYVPRPPNPFILYRASKTQATRAREIMEELINTSVLPSLTGSTLGITPVTNSSAPTEQPNESSRIPPGFLPRFSESLLKSQTKKASKPGPPAKDTEQGRLSMIIGTLWKMEPEAIKDSWEERSIALKQEHAVAHKGWRFNGEDKSTDKRFKLKRKELNKLKAALVADLKSLERRRNGRRYSNKDPVLEMIPFAEWLTGRRPSRHSSSASASSSRTSASDDIFSAITTPMSLPSLTPTTSTSPSAPLAETAQQSMDSPHSAEDEHQKEWDMMFHLGGLEPGPYYSFNSGRYTEYSAFSAEQVATTLQSPEAFGQSYSDSELVDKMPFLEMWRTFASESNAVPFDAYSSYEARPSDWFSGDWAIPSPAVPQNSISDEELVENFQSYYNKEAAPYTSAIFEHNFQLVNEFDDLFATF